MGNSKKGTKFLMGPEKKTTHTKSQPSKFSFILAKAINIEKCPN
jgi:hypothetical protein